MMLALRGEEVELDLATLEQASDGMILEESSKNIGKTVGKLWK